MRLTLIAALSENGVIGREGGIPWHIRSDWKRLKTTTMGCPILMGRRTHESIGRVLPGRLNLVVTSHPDVLLSGAEACTSLDDAVTRAAASGANEAFVFGGARLYAEALPRAQRLILSRVHAVIAGDVTFPSFDMQDWTVTQQEGPMQEDGDEHAYTIVTYERAEGSR